MNGITKDRFAHKVDKRVHNVILLLQGGQPHNIETHRRKQKLFSSSNREILEKVVFI